MNVTFLHKKAIYVFDYRCIKVFLERYANIWQMGCFWEGEICVEFMDVMETLYCISILHFLKFELYEYITQTK